MKRHDSFKDVILYYYYNSIFNEISNFDHDYEIEKENSAIKYVNINYLKDDSIGFDVFVNTKYQTFSNRRDNNMPGWRYKLYRVGCTLSLRENNSDFNVENTSIYQEGKCSEADSESDQLIPIFSGNDLDRMAEMFLLIYFPDGLENPEAIPVKHVAKSIGLGLQTASLSTKDEILGRIFFKDGIATTYYKTSGKVKKENIKKGTLLYDPIVCNKKCMRAFNQTVIKGCLHWIFYLKLIKIEQSLYYGSRLFNTQLTDRSLENKQIRYEWLDIHVNALVSRILMPAQTVKKVIDKLLDTYCEVEYEGDNKILDKIACELSDRFEVSKVTAKIRMIDLGYLQISDVFNCRYDSFFRSDLFEVRKIERSYTYTISFDQIIREYVFDTKLRKMMDSGRYVFVESHICINHSKYVESSLVEGRPKLTEYAKENLEECCIAFYVNCNSLKSTGYQLDRDNLGIRLLNDGQNELAKLLNEANDDVKNLAEELDTFFERDRKVAEILENLPVTFEKTLIEHMDREDMKVEDLAEASGLDVKMIQRFRNGKMGKIKLSYIVSLCIGLQLEPEFSDDLIQKSSINIQLYKKEHAAYKFLLRNPKAFTIIECNKYLSVGGHELLGSEKVLNA